MSIGERIMELRTAAGMSQLELSRLMEVSRQAVSKWETDQSNPDAANLIRLAEILDSDIEYLTTGRRNFGRRPPVVIKTTEMVEKVVEKLENCLDFPHLRYPYRYRYQKLKQLQYYLK